MVQNGGYYTPENCRSRHKVAIIVPYRNRKENLAAFITNMHPFLMKQKLEYRIFIVEQKGTDFFNRGRLFNAGYLEVRKFGNWKCVVFHDVDLLPLDDRILYSCPMWPRHMCGTVVEVKNPSFRTLFGGVSAMIPQHFEKVNGFSNVYWGWGGEDNDLFWRIRAVGLPIVRYNKLIAKYTSLQHDKSKPNTLRYNLLKTFATRFLRDGLTTLEYVVDKVTLHHLYTHLMLDINPKKKNITKIMLEASRWI
ncbi:beta-1,4-N-acetylgalactosaminyltransferase bre-4-like [Danaus plexippus]|nr:beta-1,4-N-acetylgalactosaminyltransferase bre-4-like [Danaus plexippus plexippus]XP_032519033.1 beta-1,4-N-acetylgalactosaminyltransferase bre-4-like [Danaus plexippus]